MADHSTIEWTDATWNVITGCSIESPGCKNCYAMKLAGTRLRNHPSRAGLTQTSAAGPVWTGEVRFNEEWLRQPLQWGKARMIFVCAHGDLFHPDVPDAWLDRVFCVMALAKKHTFQVLTKRARRASEYLRDLTTPRGYARIEAAARELGFTFQFGLNMLVDMPLRNVWVGTSVENQRYADERREALREIAASGWLTWVSYEPALGPVDWSGWEFLRWLVSGGESGDGARPSHPDWHRATRDFCTSNAVAYSFKQWGAWTPGENVHRTTGTVDGVWWVDGRWMPSRESLARDDGHRDDEPDLYRVGKKAAGRLLDGRTWDQFPATSS